MPIKVEIKGMNELLKKLDSTRQGLPEVVRKELDAAGYKIVSKAKELAPTDMGYLKNAISHNTLTKASSVEMRVSVNAFYASYVEFGTGKYAAKYVASLPADWQTYAATFKGKVGSGGGIDKMLENLVDWVKRKGIIGLTSSGNRRRGAKADAEAYKVAYAIMIRILKDGIHPHPYLYPAYNMNKEAIEKGITAAIKNFIQ